MVTYINYCSDCFVIYTNIWSLYFLFKMLKKVNYVILLKIYMFLDASLSASKKKKSKFKLLGIRGLLWFVPTVFFTFFCFQTSLLTLILQICWTTCYFLEHCAPSVFILLSFCLTSFTCFRSPLGYFSVREFPLTSQSFCSTLHAGVDLSSPYLFASLDSEFPEGLGNVANLCILTCSSMPDIKFDKCSLKKELRVFYNLILGVTYHHFSQVLLVTETGHGTE